MDIAKELKDLRVKFENQLGKKIFPSSSTPTVSDSVITPTHCTKPFKISQMLLAATSI